MKQVLENKYTLLYKGMGERQRGKCFSASFNAKCLVVSKKMTILNTHTHAPGVIILYSFILRARVKQRASITGKGLCKVPFASLFMSSCKM